MCCDTYQLGIQSWQKNNHNQSSYQVNLNDVDNKTDKQLQDLSVKLVNRSINMNDKYLQQKYQDWKSKMELDHKMVIL